MVINVKSELINDIQTQMRPVLNQWQLIKLNNVLVNSFENYEMTNLDMTEDYTNENLLKLFLAAKQLEGCSKKTISAYSLIIQKMYMQIDKNIEDITTKDLRKYLYDYKKFSNPSKQTINHLRLVLSSFFGWLETEDYILKNPVKKIRKIKTDKLVKDTLTDENIEILRNNCDNLRDLAIFELLISTGMRVGELVNLNINDINFNKREAVVFGKGASQRVVYFDARTKIHLKKYLDSRTDSNPALFVHFRKPYERLGIRGVEVRLRKLGLKSDMKNIHPHKFRRTLATRAIDKGMPIEQVQKLLGHTQIGTTMHYAMVDQENVRLSHKKFVS